MTIPTDDRGFLLGDGLFETVLARDGDFDFWVEHVERLVRGCAVLGLPAPDEAVLTHEARQALEREGLTKARAAVRLTWTAGSGGRGLVRPDAPTPRLVAAAAAAPASSGPARLSLSSVRRNEASPASRLKTLSYLDNVLARREAAGRGADEALMLNTAGEVACASAANLFWVEDGEIFTPALDCGVLDGIIRQAVMSAMPVRQVRVGPQALARAQGMFLTNSLIGTRAVGELDGMALADHPLRQQVEQVIWAERRGRR